MVTVLQYSGEFLPREDKDIAAESHEVINIVKLAMDLGTPASTLRDMVFTHPIITEALNDLFA